MFLSGHTRKRGISRLGTETRERGKTMGLRNESKIVAREVALSASASSRLLLGRKAKERAERNEASNGIAIAMRTLRVRPSATLAPWAMLSGAEETRLVGLRERREGSRSAPPRRVDVEKRSTTMSPRSIRSSNETRSKVEEPLPYLFPRSVSQRVVINSMRLGRTGMTPTEGPPVPSSM